MSGIELSLVIPTFNERASIEPLLSELETALTGIRWEALFVDDSTDGTDELIAHIGSCDRRVRLLHRDENRGGLAGAVVEGLALTLGTYICVLDADLQHPPSRIPELVAEIHRTGADIVVASRYVAGGSAGGLNGPLRQAYSRGLKSLARTVFPSRLATVSDPLGGYFLFRRTVAQGIHLRPIGYKILLELLIRCPWQRVSEVPYRFEPRRHGASKADFRQGLRFLRHLALLVWDCSPVFGPARLIAGTFPRSEPAAAGSRT